MKDKSVPKTSELRPTRAQINLAARLYTLSMAAFSERDGVNDVVVKVRTRAAQRADTALNRLGTDKCELRTDVECLEVAMKLKCK